MAFYLKDERITNLTVDIKSIENITLAFIDRLNSLNIGENADDKSPKKGLLNFIIRFDNKGYRVFSFAELKNYYGQAKDIERIFFTIETGESIRSNRNTGTYLELRLDKNDVNNCFLTVTSDNKDWVDASFSAVQEVVHKYKNRNGYVRTAWTPFVIQILGVVLGFTVCLWFSLKLAPLFNFENPFIITFLFFLLLYSNILAFLNSQLLRLINNLFPNIRFVREDKERIHWLVRTMVGSSIFGIIIYLLSLLQNFIVDFVKSLLNIGS